MENSGYLSGTQAKKTNEMRKIAWFSIFVLLIVSATGCRQQPVQQSPEVILGIFGGMGPAATADLYRQIVEITPATKDQDHLPTLIYSQPRIPDRIASIRSGDRSIIPWLVEGVQRLERAGASFIAIPCNTVHYYYEDMQAAVGIPIIHMIRETAAEVKARYPGVKDVGLLATSATIETRLYEEELEKLGFRVLVPDERVQEEQVMRAVFGIKAAVPMQENEDLLALAGQSLVDRGAELLILGCTEIPLAFNPDRVDVPVVNATRVLAQRSIDLFRELEVKNR